MEHLLTGFKFPLLGVGRWALGIGELVGWRLGVVVCKSPLSSTSRLHFILQP
ncbi:MULTISPECIES: hypothetical protein [unclassified Nostoc]|uniref:hypothetical protein n=1 Tax=unclassified Nostoc TaxID=2593658 RepID=UPI001DC31A6E|nr:hypothetical protein [Nostoc sp. JL23]MBN3878810.1 hypothetical protein [Nostoc sp. JL23]